MLILPDLGRVHDRFLSVAHIARERFGGTLGGKLLFRCGFDAEGIATLIAGSVTGAVSLCIDSTAGALREGLRTGLCDFVVGNLDEAVRILKNELRRGLPVSVGLTADPRSSKDEMIERGLQPDLLSAAWTDEASQSRARIFVERGAIRLSEDAAIQFENDTSLLVWTAAAEPARTLPQIARLAAEALEVERVDTPARRRWLETGPRYLGRAFGPRQCLRMSSEEIDRFLPGVRAEFPAVTVVEERGRDGRAGGGARS